MFKPKNIVLSRAGARQGVSDDTSRPDYTQKASHPSIRPSLVTSNPVTSTGSRSLDTVLEHGGVPIGSLTLIEEHGTTDFASGLLKSVCTQAISESRENIPSVVVCIGIPDWLRALPSLAKRSRSSASAPSGQPSERMKIAWRYYKYSQEEQQQPSDVPNHYCRDVDFKTTLVPSPKPNEVHYVLGTSLDDLANRLAAVLQGIPKSTLIRVVVPSFLHPIVYGPESSDPQVLVPFFYQLKRLVASHGNAIAFVSMSLQLYPRTRPVTAALELVCDTCIELQPTEAVDEKVHGLLHINRIASLSDQGEMVEQRYMWAFKLGRHQLEVSQFGIPVDADEQTPSPSEKQTESW